MAQKILSLQGEDAPLAKNWTSKFFSRHENVKSIFSTTIESKRIEAASHEAIANFYRVFNDVKTRFNTEEDTWNTDEQGLALDICTKQRVLAASYMKKAHKKAPQNREWVMVIESISMGNTTTPPLAIFKGEALWTTWFNNSTPDFICTTSPRGWIDNTIGTGVTCCGLAG